MISTKTQKVFALAMIAFAMPGNALRVSVDATVDSGCTEMFNAEIRD